MLKKSKYIHELKLIRFYYAVKNFVQLQFIPVKFIITTYTFVSYQSFILFADVIFRQRNTSTSGYCSSHR